MTTSPSAHVTDKIKYKLDSELITKINDIAKQYPDKNSALLPALHLIQDKFGWIPPETVKELAQILITTPNKIYGILTFYTMFNTQPVGKYHIQVCRNVSCSLLGSKHIYNHLSQKYDIQAGGTTADSKYTLNLVECLGACGSAPVMMINDKYYENLTIEKVEKILETLE